MSTDSNIRIVMTQHGRGRVYINGQEVKGVQAFDMFCGVDRLNTVSLTVSAASVEVEGPAKVENRVDVTTINSDSREFRKPDSFDLAKAVESLAEDMAALRRIVEFQTKPASRA